MAMAITPPMSSRNRTKKPASEREPLSEVLELRDELELEELELVYLELDVPLTRVLTKALTPLATAEDVRGLGVNWAAEARTALWREEPEGPL